MTSSLNTIMIGQFLINLVIATSMKELMKVIQVLQFVSFFVVIQINFSPISKLLLEYLFVFATFKVIPPEAIDYITYKLGFNQDSAGEQTQQGRLLQET